MIKRLLILTLAVVAIHPAVSTARSNTVPETIHSLLEQKAGPLWTESGTDVLTHRAALRRFYSKHQYRPAWPPDGEMPIPAPLMKTIEHLSTHGLNRDHPAYHLARLRNLPPQQAALKEVLLSDAFLSLAEHLSNGIAQKARSQFMHQAIQPRADSPETTLENALKNQTVFETLSGLAPNHSTYRRLQNALLRYRRIADRGGWQTDPEAYRNPEVVKQRLILSEDYTSPNKVRLSPASHGWSWDTAESALPEYQASLFNEPELIQAVRSFQQRHHILIDGIVGPQTRQWLAQSVESKISLIRANLERWRWFDSTPTAAAVIVNIPGFSLSYNPADSPLQMKVIVGQKRRPTPIMEAQMRYLVFNPYWRIPKTILAEDMLPKLRADRTYLALNDIQLFSAHDTKERHPLNPADINWQAMTKNRLSSYIFRQDHGPGNPLGPVKFIFPNQEDIYIHATPTEKYFKNNTFLVSSGCIRAEKPLELAYEILQREQQDISYQKINQMIQSGQKKVVWLKSPLPVFLTYQTAWVDDSDRLHLQRDVYEIDRALLPLFDEQNENKAEKQGVGP